MSIRKIFNSLEKSWERDDVLLKLKKGFGTDEIINEFLEKNEREIKELYHFLLCNSLSYNCIYNHKFFNFRRFFWFRMG